MLKANVVNTLVRGCSCVLAGLVLSACGAGGGSGSTAVSGTAALTAAQRRPAVCANMSTENYLVRNELVAGSLATDPKLLLRFVQLTDDHIIDDDGQAVAGAGILDPVQPTFEAAMRLQEEYSDEVLNSLITGINACNQAFPSSFAMVTGDVADLTTVGETRRFIDNMDGTFDEFSAFETKCRANLPASTPEAVLQAQCTRFTGRGVADTQAPDPDPSQLTTQLILTRSVQQLLNTELAATTGRAANGSLDPSRQTATRTPGMPEVLRCHAGEAGCENAPLDLPYMVAFGNHDGYARGTLAVGLLPNAAGNIVGRHLMYDQSEFIDEFFFTRDVPGPVGHGFQFAEAARRNDTNPNNDGYYAYDAGNGRFRMIVMNTIMDGRNADLPPGVLQELLRNPFALADGGMDFAQFRWIKDQLADAYAKNQLVMIFSHHPDLSFAEFGQFSALVPIEVHAGLLDATFASYPNVIAWVAGHTHRHRIRAFTVADGIGSNGPIAHKVACKGAPGSCRGFWEIETASLIDFPQQQRLIEVFDNNDGTGTIRGSVLNHSFERSRKLAEADDRCALYLTDPAAVAAQLGDADIFNLCMNGGTRDGEPKDRNVELQFAIPSFQ